jgi:hypothetical protein
MNTLGESISFSVEEEDARETRRTVDQQQSFHVYFFMTEVVTGVELKRCHDDSPV